MRLDEKLHAAFEQQLGNHVSGTIIKRGWSYYKDGHVQNAKETVHDTLTGIVRGSDLYAVVMDAEHFGYSTCTCPFNGYCKHMVAVYFQYCAEVLGGDSAAEQSYFRLLGLVPASVLAKRGNPDQLQEDSYSHPGEDGTAMEWYAWMEAEYGDTWKKCRHSLHALQPVLSGLKGLSKDWEPSRRRLHWSTAILFVLEQAERAINTVDSFSRYYHEMSFLRMAEPWIEHLHTLSGELQPASMSDAEQAWCDELIGRMKARALMTDRQLFEWGHMYLAFCEKLSADLAWHKRELDSLLSELGMPSPSERNDSFLHAAVGMLYFLRGEDEQSIHYFAQGAFERIQKLIYPCVAQRMEAGQWDLVERWMSFLNERVYQNRNARNIGPFMALCRRADEDRPELPVWNGYMTELLPYSYSELSEHWLSLQRYEDWTDLQMFLGVKAEEIDAAAMREVAKAAPHVLLPLYHQSVDSAIASRNRQGYRLAVKQLKKLEKLYKSIKETAKWDAYLTELVTKNQRLRALQEELWKGKIIT
ncbi:SWIM zinc finger domain-containing protein [Paenibacillus sp. NPDC057967]|uniref:SWIM zinc finger family protein n=1 Tax=Paenibacillus sp. NPDC057967 TaxID=3346293 RepID=UPI0036D7B46C